jgi:exopolyphosphatase/guanosine-5'-triphosphate,3'-diphosphate pyrophosphatase
MSETRRIAAVDIGTVTARLLVADVCDGAITELVRSTDIVHLGSDLAASGRLATESIARVSGVVAEYVRTIAELDVERVAAVATSAARDAENGGELLSALSAAGVTPRIIEGEEEARLSYLGATWSVTGEGLLVVDVGGGSTELIFGSSEASDGNVRNFDIHAMRSVDVGSRRITEMFLHADPPTFRELDEARAHVADALKPFFDALRIKPRVMVSLAGAATTYSAINLGLAEYDPDRVHLSLLTGAELSDSIAMLAAMPLTVRREVVGLHPGRAPVIVGGGIIIECALALAGLDSTLVSEHDILYGILLDTYRDLKRGGDADDLERQG